jgi:hypothetical protein
MEKRSCRRRLTAREPEYIPLLTLTAMTLDIGAVNSPTESVVAIFAVVWEGPTGHDSDSPVGLYNQNEIAPWGRS